MPNVRVTYAGEVAVLFLFGEEIRGAKQNRVANASFLVPAKRDVVLDVSCVESGRWHRSRGARFQAADALVSTSLRRKMAQNVSVGLSRGPRFDADQGEVWNEIGERLRFARAESPTSAYADYRRSRAAEVEEIGATLRPVADQVGFVAAIDGEIAGAEALGSPEVFAASFDALVRGYAIDAVDASFVRSRDGGPPAGTGRFRAPEPFLAAVARARLRAGASLGLGEDLRLEGEGLVGCALACGGLVHLTAFPDAPGAAETPGPSW